MQNKIGGHRLCFRDKVRRKYSDFKKIGTCNGVWSNWFIVENNEGESMEANDLSHNFADQSGSIV